ncbi:polysaccharide lyase family 8 super-sandwich domain-containing protein [Amedibacterium intestinale]|uniref:polysaccharide lyase family 8 super-sandwich domain-containing protein n=1 Tax=Amedibacterium intestinale TaxID=2583452 RepID=UPI000E1FD54F
MKRNLDRVTMATLLVSLMTVNQIMPVLAVELETTKNTNKEEKVETKEEYGENSIVNGGFEQTENNSENEWKGSLKPVGWVAKNSKSNAEISKEEGTFVEGKQSVKLTYTTASPRFIQFVYPEGGIQEGAEYVLSFWMKNEQKVDVAFQQAITVNPENIVTGWSPNIINANESGSYHEIKLKATKAPDGKPLEAFKIIFYPDASATKGSFYLDDVSLRQNIVHTESMAFEKDIYSLNKGESIKTSINFTPEETIEKNVTYKIEDESIASIDSDGTVHGISSGTTTLTATNTNNPSITASTKIRVVDGFSIIADRSEITKDKKIHLETLNAPNEEIVWETEDKDIAEVINGFVFPKTTGTVNITATSGEEKATFELTIKDYVEDHYDAMRHNYSDIIGELNPDYTDENVRKYMDELFSMAKEYWDILKKNKASSDTKPLWQEDYQGGIAAKPHIRDIYFLKIMAQAFLTEGSPYQYDPMLYEDLMFGVNWWLDTTYTGPSGTPAAKYYIGPMDAPIEGACQLNNFVTLMYDFLSQDEINKIAGRVNAFIPDPSKNILQGNINMTGSNRLDFCKNSMVANVLLKNEEKILDSMNKAFANSGHVIEIVKSGDGFYYDGSTVFHVNKAYTSGYGRALIAASGTYLHVLEGVDKYQEYVNEKADLLSEVIMVNYVPVVWKGLLSDTTAGRGISRELQSQEVRGLSFINGMVQIARVAKPEDKKKLLGALKYWIEENPRIMTNLLKPTSKEPNYPFVKFYKEALEDENVESLPIEERTYAMNQMAKYFHNRTDYSYQISMYNNRITNTEIGNNENMKGFHLGDGWTVLNNEDIMQYLGDTWATIDWKRLPGTTVDTLSIDKLHNFGESTSQQKWVGGSVIDEKYGAAGMILDKSNAIPAGKGESMNLMAKKSWFTFDDEIVAMGSGINSSTGRNVETTVENRKIQKDGSNKLIVNGKEIAMRNETSIEDVSYAYLQGNVDGSDIGYYFPNRDTLHVKKQEHSGYWKDINDPVAGFTTDSVERTDTYATMWFDHGVDPANEQYSYVLLPGKSEEETKAYAQNPQIEILEQSDEVHAVRHNGLNIIAINNFSNHPVTIEGITVDKEASVMVRTYEDGRVQVSAMCPIRETEKINVSLEGKLKKVISKDSNITLLFTA